MAVLILALPVAIVAGYRLTSRSTAGEVLGGTARPTDPGYTALVEPTPVALVLQVDANQKPESATMISLNGADQHGGSVVPIPLNTRLSGSPLGFKTIGPVIAAVPAATAGAAIGKELGLGFTDVIEVNDDELTQFLQPVSPLTIDNPDDVTAPDGSTIPAGQRQLSAEEIPGYLAAGDSTPTVVAHLHRQALVWKAWAAAVAADPAGVPGESGAGLGRYIRGLAAGKVTTGTLPTVPASDVDGSPTVKVDKPLEKLLIANTVPFVVGAVPGARPTVRLLNGVSPKPAPASVIQRLSYAGAQINTVGNAAQFGVADTTISYTDPKDRTVARRMAAILGHGQVRLVRSAAGSETLTIVLGRDLVDHPPAPLTVDDVGK